MQIMQKGRVVPNGCYTASLVDQSLSPDYGANLKIIAKLLNSKVQGIETDTFQCHACSNIGSRNCLFH